MLAEHTAAWWEPRLGVSLGCRQRMRQSTNGKVAGGLFPSLSQDLQDRRHNAQFISPPARNYPQLEDTRAELLY